MEKLEALKKYFGYDGFRVGQEDIIDNILAGRDVLCVMPTSAGKSLCYQIPALLLSGITIVISPLISLMKDQVSALVQNGVHAAYLNSTLTPAQYSIALDRIAGGAYKIIYVAPERLDAEGFLRVIDKQEISLVAVDEAHCISQWGQDFRPSYLKIRDFVNKLKSKPVVGAFTATATRQVKIDIREKLGLVRPFSITTGFDRPNLFFGVIDAKNKTEDLLKLLAERQDKSGIVYCLTRAAVEEVCETLCQKGYNATRYHAGLSQEERSRNQDDFIYDRKPIIVATNAFGMCIDKSDVSFVIHYNMPKNLESYYQEAGRAGRDGEPADCIILYSPADVQTNKFLIEHSAASDENSNSLSARKKNYELLKRMVAYCTTTECLRAFILDYFGERPVDCGNCSNCKVDFTRIDVSYEARVILNCVKESGQRFGITVITRTVYGSADKTIMSAKLDKLATYGKLRGTKRSFIRLIIDKLIETDLLHLTDSEYPVLKLTQLSEEFLQSADPLYIKIKKPKEQDDPQFDSKHSSKIKPDESDVDERLFGLLRAVRLEISTELHIPAYVVFHDSTLKEMCRVLPRSVDRLLEVSGVGTAKATKFGDRFIDAINKYLNSKDIGLQPESPKNRADTHETVSTPELSTETIINSLSENKDPFSGDTIIGMSAELINYIRTALEDREKQSGKPLPERDGKPWSKEEDEQITNEYRSGSSITQIASAHKRTYGEIKFRLEKLGIIDEN